MEYGSFYSGRYAAIDVGSNSVLLLVADVDDEGRLAPAVEKERITRLSERCLPGGRLTRAACERTLAAVCEFIKIARRSGASGIAAVGTAALRDASNGSEFRALIRQECGIPIEVISGDQEAELSYRGNEFDRRLPGVDGERVIMDVGGGSTEIVRGVGHAITARASYPVGTVRLTEQYLKADPPSTRECEAADALIEQVFLDVQPIAPSSLLLGSGGTLYTLASIARASGMLATTELHGAVLTHRCIAELLDVLRSAPVHFRKRLPGLDPGRADIIVAGAMIVHQLMARLSAPQVTYTENGVRHGCVYAMAQRALQRR